MPRIETYQQRTRVQGAPTGVPAEKEGRGLAVLGGTIAGEVADSVDLVARRDAANAASAALADLRVRTTKRVLDAQNGAAPDAAGFTDGVLSGFDEDLAEVIEGASSRVGTTGR